MKRVKVLVESGRRKEQRESQDRFEGGNGKKGQKKYEEDGRDDLMLTNEGNMFIPCEQL